MGTYGHEPFDNDDAHEWIHYCRGIDGAAHWVDALASEVGSVRPMAADAAAYVIATAAALVAATGVDQDSTPPKNANRLARGAETLGAQRWRTLRGLLDDCRGSELDELWSANTAEYAKWLSVLDRLTEEVSRKAG